MNKAETVKLAQVTGMSLEEAVRLNEPKLITAGGFDHGEVPGLVGIGASAGGLEAMERLFKAMPPSTGLAFVVIQHLSPDFKSLMGELLERFTAMRVMVVEDRVEILPDTVYLLAPKKELTVDGNILISREKDTDGGGLFMPINIFFRSMAISWRDRCAAVVLSGTGSDGSSGVMDVRDAGGLVLVETPEACHFDGMPQSAIATGCADAVVLPEEMPALLTSFVEDPLTRYAFAHQHDIAVPTPGIPAILHQLKKVYNIDFTDYKAATIARRIGHRLAMMTPQESVEEYSNRLLKDPDELDRLYKDLLIGVTRFFRDADTFALLQQTIVPEVVAGAMEKGEIRVWVCGCSTGEEAYSLAIVFLEAIAASGREYRLKILATDLHEDSLRAAAEGEYRASSFADMPESLRDKYFERISGDTWKVLPHLRKHLIFSAHNLLENTPFTRLHFVSCRNLLIYLQPVAQTRSLAALSYSLQVGGVMLLGPSETLGDTLDGMEVLDRTHKIFRKTRHARGGSDQRLPLTLYDSRGKRFGGPAAALLPRIYDRLLDRYIPAGILINDTHEIQHIFGDADAYIEAGRGRFSGNILKLLPTSLSLGVSAGLRSVMKTGQEVCYKGVRFLNKNDQERMVTINISSYDEKMATGAFYLVRFTPEAEPSSPEEKVVTAYAVETTTVDHLREMEHELSRTRESLQSTVEELEAANEELQAANEEMQASNEELQSTNEELHSVNEELYSVNAEHEQKIVQLNIVSSDLRNLMQSTDTATIFLDLEGRIKLYTPGALGIFRFEPRDIGRELAALQPMIPDPTLFEDIGQVAISGTRLECSLTRGEQTYIRSCSPYRKASGVQEGVVLNYVDTTMVSKVMNEISDSENRFRNFMDNNPVIAWIKDEDGRHVYLNRTYELTFGVRLEDWRGRTDAELWPEDIARIFRDNDLAVLRGGAMVEVEETTRDAQGQSVYWRNFKFPMTDHRGRRYVAGMGLNITDHKLASDSIAELNRSLEQKVAERTARLRESEEEYRALIENCTDVVFTLDRHGLIRFISPALDKLFGIAVEDVVGRSLLSLMHEEDAPAFRDYLEGMTEATESAPSPVYRMRGSDGAWRSCVANGRYYGDPDGERVYHGISRDMTDLIESERELKAARRAAEAASQAKSGFLANMSHEIRTPMNGIIGTLQLLRETGMTPEQTEYVTMAAESSQRLTKLLTDILDISKVEAGKLEIVSEPFCLHDLLRQARSLYVANAAAAGVDLTLDVDERIATLLMGDALRLQQVLSNLIGNALKFTQKGHIDVSATLLPHGCEDRQRILFMVTDTGVGISPGKISELFEPFSQVDSSYTRRHQGAGLGLSICRRLIGLMGGAMTIDSEPGEGTTLSFTITFPVARDRRTSNRQDEPAACSLQTMRVLLAEDDLVSNVMATRMMEKLGCAVTSVLNGREALQALQENSFEAVVMDIQMPELNGLETTRLVRQGVAGNAHRDIPIVALTAYAMHSEKEEFLAAGVNKYIAKPLDVKELEMALMQIRCHV